MSLNFFKTECQFPSFSFAKFGLCDKQDGSKAYPDISNKTEWIAEVRNDRNHEILITAIDKCIINDNEYEGRGRCDLMLTTDDHLFLIELKNQKPPWQASAIEQLDSTIRFLFENHDISKFKKRKAFACNKKRDKFVVINNEFNKAFYRRTSFRIDIQTEVVVI
jgi:hypothetical protein